MKLECLAGSEESMPLNPSLALNSARLTLSSHLWPQFFHPILGKTLEELMFELEPFFMQLVLRGEEVLRQAKIQER